MAEATGMREGGVLIEVNGRNVEEANHETVLRYIIDGEHTLTAMKSNQSSIVCCCRATTTCSNIPGDEGSGNNIE